MPYQKGPLDPSRFSRSNDNLINTKQNGNVPHNNRGVNLSLMYGGEVEEDSSPPQYNGNMNGMQDHIMNGYSDSHLTIDQPVEFSVNVRMLGDEKRFGFSVMGGVDEGFPPNIDNFTPGSPAERAGLLIGDEILEVNGVSTSNFSHAEVILAIHKCLKNRVIALKLIRGVENEENFSTFVDAPDYNGTDHVDPATQEKINSIMRDQESDPQFTYYNSDAETASVQSYNDTDQVDAPGNLRPSASWISDTPGAEPTNLNSYKKNLKMESNLKKNKSLSTAVFDLTKLDSIDDDDAGPGWSLHNNAYDTDSDTTSIGPSRVESATPTRTQAASPDWPHSMTTARPSTFTPLPTQETPELSCIDNIKPTLTSSNDRQTLSNIESYLEKRDVQNATKIYGKIMELKRARTGPGFTKPQSTNAHNLSSQIAATARSDHEQELADLLSSPNLQGLLLAHDRLAFREALPDEDEDEEDDGRELSRPPSVDADQVSQVEDDSVKIVRIDKSIDPLGATVKNEDGAVLIGRIVKGGAAEKSGLLHEGDEILQINGVNMKGKTVSEVCELLADMNGTLTFVLIPNSRSIGTLTRDRTVHVRANFDYDPYDDEFVPCRELGLAFRRGDILHVVDQDDPNWWQAWRAGEEGMKLAGLIPSKHFQQQRESLKHTVPADDKSSTNTKRRCLCIKRKRRKKVLYNANQNEVFEVDQVLTYDEVDLLQPNPTRKRPIVLIGPPKIGRKELRQRLIQYSPDRFAGAIPHTSRPIKAGEVNGRDYFFVPRHTFVADIVSHKFVEHGDLQDQFYGTSFDSIRMVANAGKVCILNFQCEALKSLRGSNIKPYVIFISPPSFERIRALRRGKVDPFNPKIQSLSTDREIHDMVERGREMEDAYGHYFDYKLTNTDFERTFDEIRQVIDRLDSEPQWVPVSWLR